MTKFTLIDGNNWLRRKYEEDRDISGLRSSLNSLRSEIANPNAKTVVFWDGAHANRYRKDIYPNYKSRRTPSGQEEFFLQINIFRDIVKNLPVNWFRVDGYEADDLIAGFVRLLPEGTKVHIKSTDRDFEQLRGITKEGKTLSEVVGEEIPPELVVPYKIMVGDTSDSITGIPGFGDKRWILSSKSDILRWYDSDLDPNLLPEMSEKLTTWATENVDQLRAMRDICLFRPVDKDFLADHMQTGIDDPEKIELIMKENMA